ncbi:hypothetical protein GCK32_014439, partial [Trichostrongylus colubriformis]
IAMCNMMETGSVFNVARAIIIWTAENQNRDLAMTLFKQLTIERFSNADAHSLQQMAVESGLECVAAMIFSRYHVTSPVARRLFHDEAESSRTTAIISEQNVTWELPTEQNDRLAAGKNIETENKEMHEHEKKGGVTLKAVLVQHKPFFNRVRRRIHHGKELSAVSNHAEDDISTKSEA